MSSRRATDRRAADRRDSSRRAAARPSGQGRAGARRAPGQRARTWPRTLTGLLAGGLVALALALVVAWFVADRLGAAGPGPVMLVGHGVAAVLAVLAQVHADRRTGRSAQLAMGAVVVITLVVLGAQWLA